MVSTIGVNLRVTGHCNQGGRKYMEDAFVVAYQQTENERDLEYAYFGIFDGHGGREAAIYAKENLMDHIVSQKNFWSDDDDLVLKAIRDGFITTHLAMWKEVGNWPKTVSGLPSTSGTTSSIAFIRQGKMYIGHVGDSKIVLGYQEPGSGHWLPWSLTKDHKPESPKEKKRIYSVGGLVMNKAGVERVVWNRPRIGHKGPIRRSTPFDQIPFLAVARSLGDLWSYNYLRREFVVSPEPDVTVFNLDPKRDRCIILASDGLWNMVSTRDAVSMVQAAEEENERIILEGGGANSVGKPTNNPSKMLVDKGLENWYRLRMRADNTSVVTVLLDPPGPPRSEVLLRQKIMKKLRPRDEQAEIENPVQNGNDTEPMEMKSLKNLSSDNNSPTTSDESSAAKERKRDFGLDDFIHKLPKPVILSPQRIFVKHRVTLGKPPNDQNIENVTKMEETENNLSNENPVTSAKNEEIIRDPPKILCENSKQNIESLPTAENRSTVDSKLSEHNHFIKENDCSNNNVACSSSNACKISGNDTNKDTNRTHLSEVDNLVKTDELDSLVRTLQQHSSEVKSKMIEEVHKVDETLTLKRKGDDDDDIDESPAKNLRISRTTWLRECNNSNNLSTSSSQLRIRKVKVR